MKKKKLSEMKRLTVELEAKVRKLKESRSSTGLAFLIESELEKAEVLLVAKSIVDRLQRIAEDIAKIEAHDILPTLEAMKMAYGADMADAFASTAGDTLRGAVTAITKAKDVFAAEAAKMERVLNGEGPANDMAAIGPEEIKSRFGKDDEPEEADDRADEDNEEKVEKDISDLEDELFRSRDEGNAAGRARKESVEYKNRKFAKVRRLGK